MYASRSRAGLLLLSSALALSCTDVVQPDPLLPPHAAQLTLLRPSVVLPGTMLEVVGKDFGAGVQHLLVLSGSLGGRSVQRQLPLQRVSVQLARLSVDQATFASLGDGKFDGTVQVITRNSVGEARSNLLKPTLSLAKFLTPVLKDAGKGLVYLNSRVTVLGAGILLGAGEGTTRARLQGCFLPASVSGTCHKDGAKVDATAGVTPSKAGIRDRGTFELAPGVMGIAPGSFAGTLTLHNHHSAGKKTSSTPLSVSYYLDRTRIEKLTPASASLGQYLSFDGAGFVGGTNGSTSVSFAGTFTPGQGSAKQVSFHMVASYVDGEQVRYVLEEKQGLGGVVNLRKDTGSLSGDWTPTIYWGKSSIKGQTTKLKLLVRTVKQVVWVRFTKGYKESLRTIGLASAEAAIRRRILDVLKRDYHGINVEFREEEPKDFKLYVKLDIGGKDPNGLGLLGYDNTPGKDVGNKRLYDWIGGVNARTQQDGYPGYGGVFLESLLGFSEHPPKGMLRSPLHTKTFDAVFDTFRFDGGKKLTSGEALTVSPLSSGASCPSVGDRQARAACAIWVLANVIGSTASHELGHSFGLAEPYGSATQYHNLGDLPNRLMEAGSTRPFDERAEINGKGPAVFCKDEYKYLQTILPLDASVPDPVKNRPSCN